MAALHINEKVCARNCKKKKYSRSERRPPASLLPAPRGGPCKDGRPEGRLPRPPPVGQGAESILSLVGAWQGWPR